MADFLKKYINDKKTWKSMESRTHALPEEYDFVYHKIQSFYVEFFGRIRDGYDSNF